MRRLVSSAALIIACLANAQGCQLVDELIDDSPDQTTARQILAELGAGHDVTTLEDAAQEEAYLAAAAAHDQRRVLTAELVGRGCDTGSLAAYRAWNRDADWVVVESAAQCNNAEPVRVLTFLEPSSPTPVASCFLTKGADDGGMLYIVTDDGRVSGAPASLLPR